jgi:hypothetical protein
MSTNEQFVAKPHRAQPLFLSHDFSDEEMARDWTLSAADEAEINTYRRSSHLVVAVQLCAVRL